MESIAPPLALLLVIKRTLERGLPAKQGVLLYLKQNNNEFSLVVAQWLALLQQGKNTKQFIAQIPSQYRQVLLQILERGFAGEAIYNFILVLEEEIMEACHEELSNKLARLPFFLLIPLLLFQFPAFLLLLFGPILQNFFHSFAGG
jgi:hypothetical protein